MSSSIETRLKDSDMTPFQMLVVTICLIINTIDGFDVVVIAYAAPVLAREWNLNPGTLGILFSAGLVGMALGSLVIAPLADQIGRRKNILLCLAIITIGMFASAMSRDVIQLSLLRFVTGLGIGGMLASLNTLVAEYASEKRRGLTVSILQVGFPLGASLGGILSVWLVADFGWRALFYFGGAMSFVMIFVVAGVLPDSIGYLVSRRPKNYIDQLNRIMARLKYPAVDAASLAVSEQKNEAPAKFTSLFSPSLLPQTLAIWTGFFMTMFTFYFVVSWTPQILVAQGLAVELGISGGVLINVGGIIGSLLLGIFSARLGLGRITFAYLLATVLFMVWFGFIDHNLTILSFVAFMIGFFIFGAMIGLYATVPSIYPTTVRTTGTGWAIGVGRLGGVLGPYIAGLLIAAEWDRSVYYILLTLPLLVSAFAVFTLWGLDRRSNA